MGAIADKFASVYRDFSTDGVASSGEHEPTKSDIRAIGPLIEDSIATTGLGALVTVAYATEAELAADLAHEADTFALVYADADEAKRDIWKKTGASGAGAWENTGALHAIAEGLIGDAAAIAERMTNLELALLETVGTVAEIGNIDDVAGAVLISAVGNANVVFNDPAAKNQTIRKFEFGAEIDGPVKARTWSRDPGTGLFTLHDELEFDALAGYNLFYGALDQPAGTLPGFVGGGVIGLVDANGATFLQYTGGNAASTSFTDADATNDGIFAVKFTATDADPRTIDVADPRNAAPRGVIKAALLSPAALVVSFGVTGQSNAVGFAAPISTRQEYGAKGFANYGTVVLDLVPSAIGGLERPTYGMAAYYNERLMDGGMPSNIAGDRPVVVGTNATGGQKISEIDKTAADPTRYQAGIDQVAAAKAYADGLGSDFHHAGQLFWQGIADASAGTTRAAYKLDLKTLAGDYDADARAAAPGDYPRRTFVVQDGSYDNSISIDAVWEIAMAQVEADLESDLVSVVLPTWALPWAEDVHATAEGARRCGAIAMRKMIMEAPEAMKVVDHYVEGTTVVLVCNRAPVIDTTLVPLQADYGFSAEDGVGTPVALASVSVSGRKITVDLGVDPSGHTLFYAKLSAAGMAPYIGLAGNIRDSSGDYDVFEDWPMHDWLLAQEWEIA